MAKKVNEEVPSWQQCVKELGRMGREKNGYNPWQGIMPWLAREGGGLIASFMPADQRDAFKTAFMNAVLGSTREAISAKLDNFTERQAETGF